MCVRYNGAESAQQDIPGGGPQGGLLTVILFDLQVALAGAPCQIPALLPPDVSGPELAPHHAGPLPLCHLKEKIMKKKYVDDLSFLESINLKLSLVPSTPIIGPPNQHEQPGLHLPPDQSVLQHQLADLLEFTDRNKMKINHKKTKILPFNVSKKYDFLPQLHFPESDPLEVIYETRLLGVTISSNLTWTSHVNDISKRATAKLWILVRFKELGGSCDQLLKVFQTRIRSTLEFAALVFTSGLNQEQSRQLEMVQKKALAVILGMDYVNYEAALLTLQQQRLDTRRLDICYKFALKCTNSPRHSFMFPPNPNHRANMRHPKPYKEYLCHTGRYFNSPIPALSRLLNKRSRDNINA